MPVPNSSPTQSKPLKFRREKTNTVHDCLREKGTSMGQAQSGINVWSQTARGSKRKLPCHQKSRLPTASTDAHTLLLFVRVEECINFPVHSFRPLKRQCLWRFLGFFLKQQNCILDSEVAIPEGTLSYINLAPCDGFHFYLFSDTLNFSRKVPVPGGRHWQTKHARFQW